MSAIARQALDRTVLVIQLVYYTGGRRRAGRPFGVGFEAREEREGLRDDERERYLWGRWWSLGT
eukprot:3597933-Pyramimonas_sp.AAC.3